MGKIFSGIYKNFKETDGKLNVFQSEVYLKHIKSKLPSIYENNNLKQFNNLSLLILILSGYQKQVTILDWGGGAGESFFQLNQKVYDDLDKINWCIMDNSKIIEIGEIFSNKIDLKQNVELTFLNLEKNYQVISKPIDILQLGSVLQYIEDWRDILLKLFKYESRYLLLEDIFTGTIPQFVTVQEFFSNKIPFQFINIEDLIKFINDSQYKIISISDCIPIINNKEMFYDMSDFPSELRIDRTKSFILKNKY